MDLFPRDFFFIAIIMALKNLWFSCKAEGGGRERGRAFLSINFFFRFKSSKDYGY